MTKIPKFKFLHYLFGLLILTSCFWFVATASAASLYFKVQQKQVGVGDIINADLFLDSQEKINALEGVIIYPVDKLEIKDWSDGGTVVSLWITKPKAEDGMFSFAGMIPGGFAGRGGKILSLEFVAKKSNQVSLNWRDTQALLNDGQGTPASLSLPPLSLNILPQSTGLAIAKPEDRDPPETFVPLVSQDSYLFGGQYFLTFATQDKGSGLAFYAVLESSQREIPKEARWVKAESPYLLSDQSLRSFIFIKAADKAGNERIAMLPPGKPFKWYENYLVWSIIVLMGGLVFIISFTLKRFLWRKNHPN